MQRRVTFDRTVFSPEVLLEACQDMDTEVEKTGVKSAVDFVNCTVTRSNESWTFYTLEEFTEELRRGYIQAHLHKGADWHSMQVDLSSDSATVTVEAPDRAAIQRLLRVFYAKEADSRLSAPPAPALPPPVRPRIFIGHGRSGVWRDLKDHLQDQHGYSVVAYEVGARAGLDVKDILLEMLETSSFACLVMTGEDLTAAGTSHARQNVVHELGLFQGRLGFNKAIALVEDGVDVFSNINGIQRLNFDPGRISTTFGHVLAAIRREFPASHMT